MAATGRHSPPRLFLCSRRPRAGGAEIDQTEFNRASTAALLASEVGTTPHHAQGAAVCEDLAKIRQMSAAGRHSQPRLFLRNRGDLGIIMREPSRLLDTWHEQLVSLSLKSRAQVSAAPRLSAAQRGSARLSAAQRGSARLSASCFPYLTWLDEGVQQGYACFGQRHESVCRSSPPRRRRRGWPFSRRTLETAEYHASCVPKPQRPPSVSRPM